MRTMLTDLLPNYITIEESTSDIQMALSRDEAEAIRNSSLHRIAEFTTVRALAHRALARLGVDKPSIPRGKYGEPIWPQGVIGSLTHCSGYRAAAVTFQDVAPTLGIDAEVIQPIETRIYEVVASPHDYTIHGWERGSVDKITSNLLYFSAKESVFKALFGLTGTVVDFSDISITLDAGFFYARVKCPMAEFHTQDSRGSACTRDINMVGRWKAESGLILTTAMLEQLPLSSCAVRS